MSSLLELPIMHSGQRLKFFFGIPTKLVLGFTYFVVGIFTIGMVLLHIKRMLLGVFTVSEGIRRIAGLIYLRYKEY